MKREVFTPIKYIVSLLPLLAVLFVITTSLDWGLPNQTINDIVLPSQPKARTKVLERITQASNDDLDSRPSLVIEGLKQENPLEENLRVARRYLLYTENPDEMLALGGLSGINPNKLKFRPKSFNYGGGYIYPMGSMIAAGRIIQGKSLNISLSNLLDNPKETASLYIWGRALNIIAILILFGGLFLIFYSQGLSNILALFASSIIVSSPAIVNCATLLKPHLLGAAFFTLSVAIIMIGKKKGKIEKYFLFSMCLAGYACSAQYFMITAGLVPTIMLLESSKLNMKKKIILLAAGIGLAGVTFFVLNPYHLFNLKSVFADLERGKDYYPPDWFNIKAPYFFLWIWGISSGFATIPLFSAIFVRKQRLYFLKKYNPLIITIIIFGYYLISLCIPKGLSAINTRLFLPVIILINILLLLRLDYFKNKIVKRVILCLAFIGAVANTYTMKTVFSEGKSPTRPYIEASRYFNKIYDKYDTVFSKHLTPAPYVTPACSIECSIKPWDGSKLKKNELLVSDNEVKGLKLIKSFNAKHRYFKMSFAEKDFYFYIKPEKK